MDLERHSAPVYCLLFSRSRGDVNETPTKKRSDCD